MSISARCECGNRMVLADVMAGKTIRCSKCGGEIFVPQSAGTSSHPRQMKPPTPTLEISPAIIISAIVGVVVLVIALAIYFGPWTVGKQWAAMSGHANEQVTDVVDFAIRAYESQNGMYDASQSHRAPQADGPATFVPPAMAFTMPQRIIFTGKTNQGNYIGTYDTTNGEINADIEIGGFTVGGLVDVNKATGKFHITGREKENQPPEAEVDGVPLKIVMLKHIKDE